MTGVSSCLPLAWSGPGSLECPDTVRPERRLEVHQEGASITSIHAQVLTFDHQNSKVPDMRHPTQGDLVVTGGSDGASHVTRLSTGETLCLLSQVASTHQAPPVPRGPPWSTGSVSPRVRWGSPRGAGRGPRCSSPRGTRSPSRSSCRLAGRWAEGLSGIHGHLSQSFLFSRA